MADACDGRKAVTKFKEESKTKTYYCVLSLTCIDGRTAAAITNFACVSIKPKITCLGAGTIIVRTDWFESREEAEKAVEEIIELQHTNTRRVAQCGLTKS